MKKSNHFMVTSKSAKGLIKSDLNEVYKQGASITVTEDGYMEMHAPGWYSPKLHPLAAYRVSRDYFNSYEEFLKDIEYDKTPPDLRTSGEDITDIFFIVTGGRGGLSDLNDILYDSLSEEIREGYMTEKDRDKIWDNYDEDNMLEYVWKNLNLKTNEDIAKFIENRNSIQDVFEIATEFVGQINGENSVKSGIDEKILAMVNEGKTDEEIIKILSNDNMDDFIQEKVETVSEEIKKTIREKARELVEELQEIEENFNTEPSEAFTPQFDTFVKGVIKNIKEMKY